MLWDTALEIISGFEQLLKEFNIDVTKPTARGSVINLILALNMF